MKMEYSQLGSTDMFISRISFGCMSLVPEGSNHEYILHEAVAGGINFFDTADLYNKGENEVLVGKALKGKRDQVFIASKVGNKWRSGGTGWDWDPSKKYIIGAVEESLVRLATDHIDLYQLHGGTMEDPIDETIEAFELLKAQGKIRHYGISSIRPNVIRRWVEKSGLSSVMMQYSLLDQRPAEECLPLLRKQGIGVLTRGGLAQGLLVGKPGRPYLNRSEEDVRKAMEALTSLVIEERSKPSMALQAGDTSHPLASNERSKAILALQYVLHHPAVTSAVVGVRTMEQLQDILAVADHLSDLEYQQLAAAVPPNFYQEHR
jgi:aryl-alcohol dehydrogenase-like predicted oxidoreductase